jgi:CSLREA domain-containing protein
MKARSSREGLLWSSKTKALAAGALMAAMMATSLLAAQPARASTTFVVNSTADTPDASTAGTACDTDVFTNGDQCTLRAAIQQANATAGPDAVNFNIPGTGVKTIAVGATGLGPLPAITDPVTINGYTQPGAHPNTKAVGNDAALKVVLDGSAAASGADGLRIEGASNSAIKGLVINRFSSDGIDVLGGGAAGTVGTRVEGNFIGTDPTGTLDRGNAGDGVSVFAPDVSQTVVGGTTPAARNLISGNRNGVEVGDTDAFFGGQPSSSVRLQGNYLGTDRNGTKDLGNDGDGIFLESASGATIGGTTVASRNVVSGNGGGLDLIFDSGTQVLGNRIGTTASGTGALGNDLYGIFMQGPPDQGSGNSIGDGTSAGSNTIAFNGQDGVNLNSSFGNKISRNSIFSNGGLGIDLRGPGETDSTDVPTPNDPGDADTGPNGLQNKPVITSAKNTSTKTTIAGQLASTPNRGYTVEFYSNPSGDEGKKCLGQKDVTTDSSGNASFTFSPASKVPAGQTVTATARSRNLDRSFGDTSEFSAPKTVGLASGSALTPDTTKVSGPSGITRSPAAHFKFDSSDPDATFECRLDGGAYYKCSSPENVQGLPEGRHTFEVRARDAEGNVDPSPAVWIWAVNRN